MLPLDYVSTYAVAQLLLFTSAGLFEYLRSYNAFILIQSMCAFTYLRIYAFAQLLPSSHDHVELLRLNVTGIFILHYSICVVTQLLPTWV